MSPRLRRIFRPAPSDTGHLSRSRRSPILHHDCLASGCGRMGNNNRMQVDWGTRVLQADASTPKVPFRKGASWDLPIRTTSPKFRSLSAAASKGSQAINAIYKRPTATLSLSTAVKINFTKPTRPTTRRMQSLQSSSRVGPQTCLSAVGARDQCSSADAAGFPIAPLLFGADELATGSINHAIRFIFPTRAYARRCLCIPPRTPVDRRGQTPRHQWAYTSA